MLVGIKMDDYRRHKARLLGLPENASDMDVHTHIMKGIPVAQLAKLLRSGDIDTHACEQISPGLALKERLADRMTTPGTSLDDRLSAGESDRLFRVVHTVVVAEFLFGSRDKAQRWLSKPKDRFSGNSPLQMLASAAGAQLVEELMTQLQRASFYSHRSAEPWVDPPTMFRIRIAVGIANSGLTLDTET